MTIHCITFPAGLPHQPAEGLAGRQCALSLPGGGELSDKISAAIVCCEELITVAQADAREAVAR
ncbi:MAG: hypothetical protein K2Q25_07965 [Mycobacteriaceae bacterium]|nr:hypothetical protein [Mycobacteriaceae bacterium]